MQLKAPNRYLKDRARSLRREATPAESQVWQAVRSRRLAGFRFQRQRPIGPYILDFYCAERGLAIELDGAQHQVPDHEAYDQERAAFLASHRVTLLRFTNQEVLQDLGDVLSQILAALSPSP